MELGSKKSEHGKGDVLHAVSSVQCVIIVVAHCMSIAEETHRGVQVSYRSSMSTCLALCH